MSYWGSSSVGNTYSKAKNSLITGFNPGPGNSSNPSYVTYSTSSTTPTPNVSYPSAPSHSKSAGKVTYYTQDWNTIKQAQYKATGKVGSGRGRGRGGYSGGGNLQAVHYCEVCKITCGTAATYKAHLEGSKHLKKANPDNDKAPKMPKTGVWKCILCEITSTSNEAYLAHMNGAKHVKKVQLHKRLGKPIPENVTPLTPEGGDAPKPDKVGEEFVETKYDTSTKRTIFFCSMCNCSFMDATAKEFHILGRRHRLEYKKKYDKTLLVDIPPNKRQKLARGRGRGGYRGTRRSDGDIEENEAQREIWEAEQRQLESEWNQYREEERWYRYIEGIKRQEEEHRQWYIQERQRCESLGIAPPPPPPRPRPPPPPPARDNSRKLLNNQDSNLIYTKHNQLQPSKPEIAALEKLVKATEDALETISLELDLDYRETADYKAWKAKILKERLSAKAELDAAEKAITTGAEQVKSEQVKNESEVKDAVPATEPEEQMEVEEETLIDDDHLVIKSCMRIGDLPKHSILKSNIEGIIAVFFVEKPTVAMFEKLLMKLKLKFAESEEGLDVAFANNIQEAAIFIKRSEPFPVEVKVQLTSTVFRDEDVNKETMKSDKAAKVLDRTACLNVLALLRQTKWFESRMSVSLIVVLQLLKDLNKRIPAWSPLSTWSLELIVERCARTKGYSSQPPQFSPAEVIRRVFELFASGFLLLNSPGLNDPCEKEPVDVLGYLSAQEREDLTASAQYALRLMVYNQLYKILGVAQPPSLKRPLQAPRSSCPESFKQKGKS